MLEAIKQCRICGNTDLVSILHLGDQYLSGVFPKHKNQRITSGPLELVKCNEETNAACGLVQLKHCYDLDEMYGENYGYRSGLNPSMVTHLHDKVTGLLEQFPLTAGDLVLDIGSNDSTLLQAYPGAGITLVGIDPTGSKFKKYYAEHIRLIPDFFSASTIKSSFAGKRAKIVTSIAMFYDLQDPLDFMKQIHEILADDGVWVFEQSYMPTMLARTSYDTVCHEHIEYYRLKQIKFLTDRTGFKILDVEFNEVNGGSLSVTVAKRKAPYSENTELIERVLMDEERKGLQKLRPYEEFQGRIVTHKAALLQFIHQAHADKKKILGYGASTKGNIVLQYCQLTSEQIACIGEVNSDKFGCYTPGTWIPIVSEEHLKALKPDYLLVLPWHFKNYIVEKERGYLTSGGKLVFPLPVLEVIEKEYLTRTASK